MEPSQFWAVWRRERRYSVSNQARCIRSPAKDRCRQVFAPHDRDIFDAVGARTTFIRASAERRRPHRSAVRGRPFAAKRIAMWLDRAWNEDELHMGVLDLRNIAGRKRCDVQPRSRCAPTLNKTNDVFVVGH